MLRAFLVLLLLALAAGGWWGWQAWQGYRAFTETPLEATSDHAVFEFPRGASYHDLIRTLRRGGYSRAPEWQWRLLALETDAARTLKAGEYALARGMTPRDLLEMLNQGRVVQHRFTLIEGWTFRELRRQLAAHPTLRQELADLDDGAVMARLGLEGMHPEGQFLPETYQFPRGFSDLELLARAHSALKHTLEQAWEARADNLPLKSPYEALILASIIERETGRADERERVAGVFVRRLQRGMRLQTDPTVIYGLGDDFVGRLRRVHLTTDTDYNTYTRHGLPPTPIAMPGAAAIRAAVNPAPGRDLYFVSRKDGSHAFSETYEQHRRAVRRYQLGQE